jgi:hypothetical protein
MGAAAQAEDERAMLDKLWRQRLERARYAADRARRQYQLAEPENRLVARQLEADWEAALAETARLEADYQRFTEEQPAALTAAERAAIQALAGDLPRVWDAPSTTQADRKELLRILIEDITATVIGDSELVNVAITWAGGHQTTGQAVRPVARLDQLSYFPALLARVTELAAVSVPGPAGHLGRRHSGVQPQRPRRVPQVLRASAKRRPALGRGEGLLAGLAPHLAVGRVLEDAAAKLRVSCGSWPSQEAGAGFSDSAARRYSALMRRASSSWSSRMTMRQAASTGVPWSTSSRARAAMRSW